MQSGYSEPGPPSSHKPSLGKTHVSKQIADTENGAGGRDGGEGGRGGGRGGEGGEGGGGRNAQSWPSMRMYQSFPSDVPLVELVVPQLL